LTTDTPGAHEFNIASSAAMPLKLAPVRRAKKEYNCERGNWGQLIQQLQILRGEMNKPKSRFENKH
jgi:dsDNA-specific endonuclease/ATPase MutS2